MTLNTIKNDFVTDQKRFNWDMVFYGAAFLFPVFMNIVSHWGSVIFSCILILSLFFLRHGFQKPDTHELFLFIGFSLAIAAISVSLINAQDLHRSIKRIGKLQYLILMIPVFIVMKKRAIGLSNAFFYGALTGGPIMMATSFFQVYYSDAALQSSSSEIDRALGSYNELVFGSIAMIFTMIIMAAIFTGKGSKRFKFLSGLAGLATLYACVLSGTRGALIVFPFVMFFQIVMLRTAIKKKIAYLLFMLIFFSISVTGSYLSNGMIKQRITRSVDELDQFFNRSNAETSTGWRLLMWEDSIKIWKKHPVIGTGIGDFQNDVERMMANKESDLSKSWKHAHNFYLEYLATTGIIGFLATTFFLLVWPFFVFYMKWKAAHDENTRFSALAGMSTLLSFSLIGLTWYWPARSPMVITYVFCLLVFLTDGTSSKQIPIK